jgi:hypothetical protein
MSNESRKYPRTVSCEGSTIDIGRMSPDHAAAIAAFVERLPTHDLLFLRRDITNPKVIAAWMEALGQGRVISLVAWRGGDLVGCTAILMEELS